MQVVGCLTLYLIFLHGIKMKIIQFLSYLSLWAWLFLSFLELIDALLSMLFIGFSIKKSSFLVIFTFFCLVETLHKLVSFFFDSFQSLPLCSSLIWLCNSSLIQVCKYEQCWFIKIQVTCASNEKCQYLMMPD